MQNNNYKLNFLGGGNIAKALITGLINSGFLSDDIKVYDIDSEKLNNLSKLTGVKGSTELSDIKDGFVILCVKPKDYPDLVLEIKNKISENVLILSCIAGIDLNILEKTFTKNVCLRFMPNMLVENNAGFFAVISKSEDLLQDFNKIFAPLGHIMEVEESKFDVITATSGSGPAWIYSYIHDLIKAGMENGLSEEEARLIVQSLFVGIANNIEFDTNFKELIKQVASPGGTTEAGLNIMSKNKLSEIINEVILEASTRSKELREDNN